MSLSRERRYWHCIALPESRNLKLATREINKKKCTKENHSTKRWLSRMEFLTVWISVWCEVKFSKLLSVLMRNRNDEMKCSACWQLVGFELCGSTSSYTSTQSLPTSQSYDIRIINASQIIWRACRWFKRSSSLNDPMTKFNKKT